MAFMVSVDAFSQALTNPLLSKRVFNKETFTQWGLDLINNTHSLGDILEHQMVGGIGNRIVKMTREGWRRT